MHRIETRIKELEEKVYLTRNHLFSKDEDNPDNFQIDAVVHIFPDDLDASDVDGD